MQDTKILGLSLGELSTAALSVGGNIVACVSEERFSRQKNDEAYPKNAIEYVLREAGIEGKDLDVVVIAGNDLNLSTHLMRMYSHWRIPDHLRAMKEYWYPKLYENKTPDFYELFKDKVDIKQYPGEKAWKDFLKTIRGGYYGKDDLEAYRDFLHKIISGHLGISRNKIVHLDHHSCHAAYAYWASPLRGEDVLVMTIDAFGDGLSSTLSLADNKGGLRRVHSVKADNFTIGRMYRYVTLLLGMEPNHHEYKVMGLAPYAKEPIYLTALNIFKRTMYVDGINFKFRQKPKDNYYWFKERLEGFRFDGIAGALQKYVEEILLEYTKNALKKFKARKLVLSGGVSMNIKANMLLKDLDGVRDMFVAPSGSDESLAIGACYAYMDCESGRRDMKPLAHAYLGPELDEKEIAKIISLAKKEKFYTYESSDDLISDLLIKGWVIGRCCGRMEFGARSLGNRSIISDPRNYSIIDVINQKIKRRDFWMPFAPSIMAEHSQNYIVNPKNIYSPFMTIGFESTQKGKELFAAAIHPADKTSRPQIVDKEINPGYHSLLNAFFKKTGVGGVLNTSFNLHGEPIVNTAQDAYRVFKITDIDALMLDGMVITKKNIK